LHAWRPGDLVRDIRRIPRPEDSTAGALTVRVGLYNRVTGDRYPGVDAAGQALPDGAFTLEIGEGGR
jgi:hypothetical protein